MLKIKREGPQCFRPTFSPKIKHTSATDVPAVSMPTIIHVAMNSVKHAL